MRFGRIDAVILFGGAPLLRAAVDDLRRIGLAVHVFTSPRHLAEPLDASGVTLGESLRAAGIPYVATDDINTEPTLPPLITRGTLGIGMGEAWSFAPALIDAFGDRLLDFMGIPLPRYRGGAHYTWMILRGDREMACNLQIINAEMIQGERDTGELVKTRRYQVPETARTPSDYFAAAVPEEIAFIREFLDEVAAGKDFELCKPDEAESLFLPRLNTLQNGWIDWSWSGREVDRFICAFDAPYRGASTRLGGKRVHLRGARLARSEPPFHPFQAGLITRVSLSGAVDVATTDGHLHVEEIASEPAEPLPRPPRPGDRFHTPPADLQRALETRATYGTR